MVYWNCWSGSLGAAPTCDRPGARVDPVVDEVEASGRRVFEAVREPQPGHELRPRPPFADRLRDTLLVVEIAALAQVEDDVDRVELDQRRQHAAVGAHPLADAVDRPADAAVEGRRDLRVAEIDLCLSQLGFARPQRGFRLLLVGDGPVERLLADVASRVQRPRPFEIAASPHHLGTRLRDPGRGGVDRRLERLPLEDEQQRALLDVVAFLEDASHQEGLDAGAQIDGVDRHGLAHVLRPRIDFPPLHGRDHDRRRRRCRLRARLLVTAAGEGRSDRQQDHAGTAAEKCDTSHYAYDRAITPGYATDSSRRTRHSGDHRAASALHQPRARPPA